MGLGSLIEEYLPSIFIGRKQALEKVCFIGNVQNSPVQTQMLEETLSSSWARPLSNRDWNSCAVVNRIKMFYTDWNSRYYDWVFNSGYIYYLRLQTMSLPEHGYLGVKRYCLRKALTASVSWPPGVFRIRVFRQQPSMRGKASSYIIASVKKIAQVSAFGFHFVASSQCRQRLRRSFNFFYLFWGPDILQKWKSCVKVYNLNSGPHLLSQSTWKNNLSNFKTPNLEIFGNRVFKVFCKAL